MTIVVRELEQKMQHVVGAEQRNTKPQWFPPVERIYYVKLRVRLLHRTVAAKRGKINPPETSIYSPFGVCVHTNVGRIEKRILKIIITTTMYKRRFGHK